MDEPTNKFALWQKEKVLLDELKALRPELFVAEKKSSETVLSGIGINTHSSSKPKGYIKYLPFDFIVEEIRPDDSVITVEKTEAVSERGEVGPTVYTDLVKTGISSIEAMDLLSKALECDKKQLSYAGIKDTVAITAQRMSIRNIPIEKIQAIDVPQLFLKNCFYGKGATMVGDLKGNRFTLLIRTYADFEYKELEKKIDTINTTGLFNYYGPQRFGSPRYISHILGQYLLQGDFEKVVRSILSQTSTFEWAFVTQLRQKADRIFGDWEGIQALFAHLPQLFRSELDLLARLSSWNGKGNKWIWALGYAPEQIDFWTKSYASYLANKILYKAEEEHEALPERIPLLLNTSEAEIAPIEKWYGAFLAADSTTEFRKNLKQIPWLRMGENSYLSTKVFPTIHAIKKLPEGVAISFDLPKGAYATTVLYELFNIVEGEEEMEGISKEYVDTKKELGFGSFDSIRQWAEQYVEIYQK